MLSLVQCKVRGSIVTVRVEQIAGGFNFLLECPPCHLFVIYSARVNGLGCLWVLCKQQLEEAWSLSKQSHLLKNSRKPRQDLKVFSSCTMWKFLSSISQYLINKLTRERIKFLPPTSASVAYLLHKLALPRQTNNSKCPFCGLLGSNFLQQSHCKDLWLAAQDIELCVHQLDVLDRSLEILGTQFQSMSLKL